MDKAFIYIKVKYKGLLKDKLINYINSNAFEDDINNIVRNESRNGEYISEYIAMQCAIDAMADFIEEENY